MAPGTRPSSNLCGLMALAPVPDANPFVIVESSSFDFSDYRLAATDMHTFTNNYLDMRRHQ